MGNHKLPFKHNKKLCLTEPLGWKKKWKSKEMCYEEIFHIKKKGKIQNWKVGARKHMSISLKTFMCQRLS